jgi:hypothetical protein
MPVGSSRRSISVAGARSEKAVTGGRWRQNSEIIRQRWSSVWSVSQPSNATAFIIRSRSGALCSRIRAPKIPMATGSGKIALNPLAASCGLRQQDPRAPPVRGCLEPGQLDRAGTARAPFPSMWRQATRRRRGHAAFRLLAGHQPLPYKISVSPEVRRSPTTGLLV